VNLYIGNQTTAIFAELFSKGKLKIEIVENYSGQPKPLSGYLVIDGSIGAIELPGYRAAMPSWYQTLPKNWDLLIVVDGKINERYDQYDPKICHIN
jgi:hypothetical protein